MIDEALRPHLVEFLLRHGDDRLVLGHRLAEWCGHGPALEEDIALANCALDFTGQANLMLGLAGSVEGKGRDQDALAYFRDEREFRNVQLVELPRGDFGVTMVRQLLFDAYDVLFLEALQRSAYEDLAGIAAKAYKEARYHLRHSAEWVVMLGDGTGESHERAQRALDELWRYGPELFDMDEGDRALASAGIVPDLAPLEPRWRERVEEVFARATLAVPTGGFRAKGGRRGVHTEHLGHLLAEMQIVARSHPGASW
ncbi:MAG TPA: 1,2-phenylacetyl-CoA epoxidase subunit PaaC [Gemmatimonadaceae bacterium]|nr:1,2-phenylacetyl-CoA epoxidase subunit PaaC [Gemmatimonadaceae bacterium]